METFIGTKILRAVAMTLGEYNQYRDWKMPDDEDPTDVGFLVEYQDGGKANDNRHIGYISWSPKVAFDSAYRRSGEMSFGHAIEMAKLGYKVSRIGWNGSDMFAYIVPKNKYPVTSPGSPVKGMYENDMVPYREYWALKTAQNDVAVWAPSGSDSLSSDWCIVE